MGSVWMCPVAAGRWATEHTGGLRTSEMPWFWSLTVPEKMSLQIVPLFRVASR